MCDHNEVMASPHFISHGSAQKSGKQGHTSTFTTSKLILPVCGPKTNHPLGILYAFV